jgi:hypothetical protein
MAKSDLLKEAIADAKAVKETALANAKIALQEAFAPRIENMLSAKLAEELEDEDEMEAGAELEAGADEMEAGAEEMNTDMDMPDMVGIGVDFNNDGDYDLEGELGTGEEEVEMGEEKPMSDDEMSAEYEEGGDDEDLNLEAIIRELEEDLHEGDEMEAEMPTDEEPMPVEEGDYSDDGMDDKSIDEIIEAILREEEEGTESAKEKEEMPEGKYEKMEEELQEAYSTVKQLQGILSEVNLLNAKLLYTNKLFRNFELSENQKMKVIENFDRAGNTREVKLVFTTLAESFNKPKTKRVVKESFASKPTATTAPSKESTQVLSEGFELANRWKKLAGLL